MPRIPTETLDRLKQDVLLQRLAEASGIQLRRHGADLVGLCPFHDRRPRAGRSRARSLRESP